MSVASILKHKGNGVVTVDPTVRVGEMTRVLTENKIGALVVLDRADQLLGIVSERDIVKSIAANGPTALEMTAGQLMTRAPRVVRHDTSVADAMRMMTEGRFRHLPVMVDDRLAGMISIGDVVKAVIMQRETEVDTLKAYVTGSA
jgi:CBS domain-containing protein